MTENYKKLSTKDRIFYGLSLIGVLGTLGILGTFAHKFNETVKSLPTPTPQPTPFNLETIYETDINCEHGGGGSYYTTEQAKCEAQVGGLISCVINGQVIHIEGFNWQYSNGSVPIKVLGKCTENTKPESMKWEVYEDIAAYKQ